MSLNTEVMIFIRSHCFPLFSILLFMMLLKIIMFLLKMHLCNFTELQHHWPYLLRLNMIIVSSVSWLIEDFFWQEHQLCSTYVTLLSDVLYTMSLCIQGKCSSLLEGVHMFSYFKMQSVVFFIGPFGKYIYPSINIASDFAIFFPL